MRSIFCFLLALPSLLLSEEILFHKNVDGQTSELSWNVKDNENAFVIQGTGVDGTTLINCSKDYVFQSFITESPSEKLVFERNANNLIATSTKNGVIKKETYSIQSTPWVQDFGFGLKPFLDSGEGTFTFYILNPKDLTLNKMIATKQDVAEKKFGDQTFNAQKVKITLTGFYSRFWKAELWFNIANNQLLMYKANEGPSTPTTTLTFMEIRN